MSSDTVSNEGITCQPRYRCIACGNDSTVLYREQRDKLFSAPGTWSLRRCVACRLAWIDPMPVPAHLSKFYETYYTHDTGAEHAASASRSSGLKRLLAAVFPHRKSQFLSGLMHLEDLKPGRLLEVGCGSGGFLAQAQSAGWRATGIDFDQSAVSAARARGADARVMRLEDPSLDEQRFDAITMNNVIEHLPDPAGALARCRDLLAPGGRLVAVTPNVSSQCHRLFGSDWRGLEVPRHLHLFTARSLRILATKAGFRRIQVFCPPNGAQVDSMAYASAEIAAREGSMQPRFNQKMLKLRCTFAGLIGFTIGEWVVLVAE